MNFRSSLRNRTRPCGGRKETEIHQIVGKHFVSTLTLCIVISFLTNSLFARIINQHDDIYIVFRHSCEKKPHSIYSYSRILSSLFQEQHYACLSSLRSRTLSERRISLLSFRLCCRACCPGSHFGFKQLSTKHSMGRRIRRCHRRLRLCRRRSRDCCCRCRRQRADG